MTRNFYLIIHLLLATLFFVSCQKTSVPPTLDPPPTGTKYVLKYSDSILYLKNQANDYVVLPTEQGIGKYYGFPEGIELDENTGAINVNKSEAGLRYRITFVSTTNDSSVATVVISGINFTDHYFHLNQGDSIANPIYNASISRILPTSNSVFDDGNGANSGGCSVRTDNGKINLAQCIRNGIFGNNPNDVRKEFDIFYRLNDNSGKAQNKIRVRLYYYNTMADVAPDLIQTLADRQSQGVFIGGRVQGHAKPRPPCIVLIAN